MSARASGPRFLRSFRVSAALLLLAAHSASAHEFWMEPHPWSMPGGGNTKISLFAGHGQDRERSTIPFRRIVRFAAVGGGRRELDFRSLLRREEDHDAEIMLPATGTWTIVLESDDKGFSHLPAERFNHHLEIEGLTPAKVARKRSGRTMFAGTESYARHAKVLITAGRGARSAAVTKPVGMRLEIVPARDPSTLLPGDTLGFRILYRGAPLAGALVKLTDLARDETPVATLRSGRGGKGSFVLPRDGRWLLHVAWTRALGDAEATEFLTDFSSLAFSNAGPDAPARPAPKTLAASAARRIPER